MLVKWVNFNWRIRFQVKAQHTERCIDFLVKELKVNTLKEAEERVFFVSARETLQVTSKESSN
jgi:mitofusin